MDGKEKTEPLDDMKTEQLQTENQQLKQQVIDLQKQLADQETKKPAGVKPGDKIRWRKTGGGTFRMANGKIIKPNQVFEATVGEIPQAFRDVIIPLGDLPQDDSPPLASVTTYKVEVKTGGWFNVINAETGKPMNEKGLRKEEAEKLLAELS